MERFWEGYASRSRSRSSVRSATPESPSLSTSSSLPPSSSRSRSVSPPIARNANDRPVDVASPSVSQRTAPGTSATKSSDADAAESKARRKSRDSKVKAHQRKDAVKDDDDDPDNVTDSSESLRSSSTTSRKKSLVSDVPRPSPSQRKTSFWRTKSRDDEPSPQSSFGTS